MSDDQDTAANPHSDDIPASDLPIPQEILNEIPEDKRADFIQYVSEISYARHFSGPVPPPDLLNQYDREVQRTIVNEAVENRRHRTSMQSRRQVLLFIWDLLTLGCAFVLALRLIDGSINIIQQGQSVEGLLGIGGTVSLVVGAFLFRDRHRRKERESQQDPPPRPELPESGVESS